ncbi:MAG TPA: response regulator transcription factor [Solirubrobacteraceae bacterium]|nr:response regulator transcription factor [Solirubrobacteraceae bacterium]
MQRGLDKGEYVAEPLSALAPSSLTVVLGDVDSRVRAAVQAGLERYGFSIVALATDADEAVEAARRHRPSVCLLDVDMPGGGIDAAERINSELPETKIAMLSGSERLDRVREGDRVREAIRAGADGYLPRSTAPDRLGAALTGLINGEAALPRSITGSLVHDLREIERRLEQSSNGHLPSEVAAAKAARARRDAAARGAAAAHRAAEARRAADARRAEKGQAVGSTEGSAERPPLRRGIGSRVLYVPRLVRHFARRLRAGMPVTTAWISARARMLDYM